MFRLLIIAVITAGLPFFPQQIGSPTKSVDVEDIQRMIDKAGWMYRDGEYQKCAVEVRRAQRYVEKIFRESHGTLSNQLKQQYLRLEKAHRLLRQQGVDLVDLKPWPKPGSRVRHLAADNSTKGSSSYGNAGESRGNPFGTTGGTQRSGDPFAQSGSRSSDSSATAGGDPFAQSNASGSKSSSGSSRSGDPFASGAPPTNSSSGQSENMRSGDPFSQAGSSSGDSGKSRSGDPFANSGSNEPPKERGGDPFSNAGSNEPPKERGGDPFAQPGSSSDAAKPKNSSGSSDAPVDDPFDSGGNQSADAGGTTGLSFTKDIAPILVTRCGTCHVDKSRGELSMASYRSLIEADSIISPKDADDSLLIQMIEDGEMPPRESVPAADLKKLRQWIDQGAQFDGDDESANISTFANSRGGRRGR